MNLAIIEKMVQQGDMSVDALRYLINCKGECEWLDFKEFFSLENDKAIADFSKDVVAVKNTGGGYIIIGVKDKTWEPVGLSQPITIDSKILRDKIRSITGLDIEVDIINHEIYIDNSSKHFSLIFVRASKHRRKRRTPSLIIKDFSPKESFGLRRGEIYFRRGDSTIRLNEISDLENLLDNLEQQTDSDSLNNSTSPFAVQEGLFRLLERGYENFIGREEARSSIIEAILKDPRIWIVNVHGPGGVGKSALVNWAVYKLYEGKKFESIIQLTAKETVLTVKGIEQYSRSLYSLENLLDHILRVFEESTSYSLEEKKAKVNELLSVWSTLIVLDNMETVQDGRIIAFVQNLPPSTKAKVLLTSRHKTGGWELPFPLSELRDDDFLRFIERRSQELNIRLNVTDTDLMNKIWVTTGGLPLAIQWILGKYKVTGEMMSVLNEAKSSDAPILEFSFRSIWSILSNDAKKTLCVLSIFNEPPTIQEVAISTEFPIEVIENAITELTETTLVIRQNQISDGKVTLIALPITLSFARNQSGQMGEFELKCRQRIQKFTDQMKLYEAEIYKFQNRFDKYGIDSENEKRAAILCQKGESEIFIGNANNAELYFKQARELSPKSAYVFAMSASHELTRNRIGQALSYIEEACKKATSLTGSLCYSIKARIHYAQKNNDKMAEALKKSLDYTPSDNILRHQYGVALSKIGRKQEAVKQFSLIIDDEKKKIIPTNQLLMALKTRMMNSKSLGEVNQFEADRILTNKIFKEHPHLASDAYHFDGLI